MTEVVAAVSMLKAFERAPESIGAPLLQYPNLDRESALARQREYTWLDGVWNSRPGSIEELDFARKAAVGYLVRTGRQLRDTSPQYRDQISERFTEASSEIYGAPDTYEAKRLVRRQLPEFVGHLDDPAVDQERLRRIVDFWELDDDKGEVLDHNQEFAMAREAYKSALEEKFGEAFKFMDPENFSQATLSPPEIVDIFNQAIKNLTPAYPALAEWKAEESDGNGINTNETAKTFKVGRNRTPLPVDQLKGRAYHEIIGHGLRSINGTVSGYKLLGTGLPGSLDTEEGFCNFMGYCLGDEVSDAVYERYIDTAAAMGLLGKAAVSRPQMHQLYLDRLVVRQQIAGEKFDQAKLSNDAWAYVNRIYRGSLGDEHIGVNTKDVVYHPGFIKIAEYVKDRLEAGVEPMALLEYLLIGRFDPTNSIHRDYMAECGYPEPKPVG